jgi:hypothetical protein
MGTLAKLYELNKEGSVGVPDRYLGANVGKFQLEDGSEAWYMSAYDYVKSVCTNVATLLAQDELKLPTCKVTDRPWLQREV